MVWYGMVQYVGMDINGGREYGYMSSSILTCLLMFLGY